MAEILGFRPVQQVQGRPESKSNGRQAQDKESINITKEVI